MSELTRCNYCVLRDIRRKNPDKDVTVRWDQGWLRVVVDGEDIGVLFLELTDGCVC